VEAHEATGNRGENRAPGPRSSLREIFWYFLKLGWLAFGGPVGQIGLMHLDVVERRRWLSEEEFVRALNFCHVLPGPEALQLAIYLGYKRCGYFAGVIAGVLFILPGYITLTALAWIYVHYGKTPEVLGVLWGFRPVGLALLLAALLRIARAALKGPLSVALAIVAFAAFYFVHLPFALVLLGAGVTYLVAQRLRMATGASVLLALAALPARSDALDAAGARLAEISWFFLKVGLISFGGAYAVLPYIRDGAVAQYAWIGDTQMIDALALGETTPGPLISIGIFVGYLAGNGAGVPWLGASAATFWLFLPSFAFVLGTARWMEWLTTRPGIREFLVGVTSGVVGLMFSISIPLALVAFTPGGVFDPWTLAFGLAAFALLTFWKWRLNVVVVVLVGGVLGLLRAFAPVLF
jgi:chromate transporter